LMVASFGAAFFTDDFFMLPLVTTVSNYLASEIRSYLTGGRRNHAQSSVHSDTYLHISLSSQPAKPGGTGTFWVA
jgi:hypothetical protein